MHWRRKWQPTPVWQAESKWRLFTVPPPKPSIRRCELWLIHLDMMLLMGNTPTGSECFNIPIPALTSPSVKRPHNHSILTLAKQRWQHYHIALLCGELHEIMNSPAQGSPIFHSSWRGRAGGCARVTAGQKKPHPGLFLKKPFIWYWGTAD